MNKYINLTPHTIRLNTGHEFPPSGIVARVGVRFIGPDDDNSGVRSWTQEYGEVEGLPDSAPGTIYVVSAMVLAALTGTRSDVAAPATGHNLVIRDNKGQILSVPGLVRLT